MQELHAALLALQEIDAEIARAQARVDEFKPKQDALEAPVATLEREVVSTRAKLEELRAEQQRLHQNSDQKRDRLQYYQDRLMKVRNSREEAAAKTELDLVKRAVEADNADLKSVGEQATRTDLKLDDLERQLAKVRANIEAEQLQLMEQREAAELELQQLRDRRANEAARIDEPSRRLYDRVRAGKSRQVLAPMTSEGACGNCFNILPLQEQQDVRNAVSLRRCEGCGVILYAA
jgi:predicted  nucleic acid-binding Zn-ribbon protein